MTIRKTALLTSGVLASAALAFMSGGAASAAPDKDVTTDADLNGDGVAEHVTVRSAGTPEQRIVTEVDGREVAVDAAADTRSVIRPPRVTDLDGDGAQELVVLEYTGANTETFGGWAYVDGELRAVGTDNLEALRLYEGGGVSARSGYACEPVGGGRQLIVLRAEVDDGTAGDLTYSGSWTYYTVRDGLLAPSGTEVTFTAVGADSPLLSPDAGTCAP